MNPNVPSGPLSRRGKTTDHSTAGSFAPRSHAAPDTVLTPQPAPVPDADAPTEPSVHVLPADAFAARYAPSLWAGSWAELDDLADEDVEEPADEDEWEEVGAHFSWGGEHGWTVEQIADSLASGDQMRHPVEVMELPDGTKGVTDGHHRVVAALRVGAPVRYVILGEPGTVAADDSDSKALHEEGSWAEPDPIEWRAQYETDHATILARYGSIDAHEDHARRIGQEWLNGPGADWLDDISDPETANGLCEDASIDLAEWATAHGHHVEVVDLNNGGPHTVVLLDGVTIIDPTLRQFDPGCDIPAIDNFRRFVDGEWNVTRRWAPEASASAVSECTLPALAASVSPAHESQVPASSPVASIADVWRRAESWTVTDAGAMYVRLGSDTDQARGMCVDASNSYADHVGGYVLDLKHPVHGPHTVAIDGEFVVDWTARQFDPVAGVPRVVPLDVYLEDEGWAPIGEPYEPEPDDDEGSLFSVEV